MGDASERSRLDVCRKIKDNPITAAKIALIQVLLDNALKTHRKQWEKMWDKYDADIWYHKGKL